MLEKIAPSNTQFKAVRPMTCRSFIDEERVFNASVELTDNVVTCILDDSDYSFTAQQCGELADGLATLVRTIYELPGTQEPFGLSLALDFRKIFYQMILTRSAATKRDRLYSYDSNDIQLGASGSFCYPGTRDSYGLFVAMNDELNLPFLGIEDRIFTFSFDEVLWLIEQLCVGGYLLAQVETPEEEFKKMGGDYQ